MILGTLLQLSEKELAANGFYEELALNCGGKGGKPGPCPEDGTHEIAERNLSAEEEHTKQYVEMVAKMSPKSIETINGTTHIHLKEIV